MAGGEIPQWLITSFTRSVKDLGATAEKEQIERACTRLLHKWSEPGRYYHGIPHLLDTLARVDVVLPETHHPAWVRLAAWYHGAVFSTDALAIYTRNGGEHEVESGEYARVDLAGLGVDTQHIDGIVALISGMKLRMAAPSLEGVMVDDAAAGGLTTSASPEPVNIDQLALNDAHLGALAVEPQKYKKYVESIRQEYAHLPIEDFLSSRIDILKKLLARRELFLSPLGKQWETVARQNMTAEVERLTARLEKLNEERNHLGGDVVEVDGVLYVKRNGPAGEEILEEAGPEAIAAHAARQELLAQIAEGSAKAAASAAHEAEVSLAGGGHGEAAGNGADSSEPRRSEPIIITTVKPDLPPAIVIPSTPHVDLPADSAPIVVVETAPRCVADSAVPDEGDVRPPSKTQVIVVEGESREAQAAAHQAAADAAARAREAADTAVRTRATADPMATPDSQAKGTNPTAAEDQGETVSAKKEAAIAELFKPDTAPDETEGEVKVKQESGSSLENFKDAYDPGVPPRALNATEKDKLRRAEIAREARERIDSKTRQAAEEREARAKSAAGTAGATTTAGAAEAAPAASAPIPAASAPIPAVSAAVPAPSAPLVETVSTPPLPAEPEPENATPTATEFGEDTASKIAEALSPFNPEPFVASGTDASPLEVPPANETLANPASIAPDEHAAPAATPEWVEDEDDDAAAALLNSALHSSEPHES